MKLLHQLPPLFSTQVVKRPSQFIKTPYIADIIDPQDKTATQLAHTPSLGCCGLADKNAEIMVAKNENKKAKSSYIVYLSVYRDAFHPDQQEIVGIHPKMAETLVEKALQVNLLSRLPNIISYRRETCVYVEDFIHSRFDFSGIDENGTPFLMEVKNVPLADYEDLPKKDMKNKNYSDRPFDSKVAYFPDGYRKLAKDPISPRALKHIQELAKIKTISKTRCLLCFIIQRGDIASFQASVIDPIYKQALKEAHEKGVEVFAMSVKWNEKGEAYFNGDNIPIYL
tara:strand:+ start:2029 stop:2877 length:849 start_codon:yes stop_codon:yes gene_type:complete